MFGVEALRRDVQSLGHQIDQLAAVLASLDRRTDVALKKATERMEKAVMAGVQELQDALTELDTTITNEIGQINAQLDDLRSKVAPDLQQQVDEIKAANARVQGIVADAVPEPSPAPVPTPEPPAPGRRP